MGYHKAPAELPCPRCGGKRSKVLERRTRKQTGDQRRRRECLDCGHRFTTIEEVSARSLAEAVLHQARRAAGVPP